MADRAANHARTDSSRTELMRAQKRALVSQPTSANRRAPSEGKACLQQPDRPMSDCIRPSRPLELRWESRDSVPNELTRETAQSETSPVDTSNGDDQPTWLTTRAAATLLSMSVDALQMALARRATRTADGGVEARLDGIFAQKFGRRWRVMLASRWTSSKDVEPTDRASERTLR